MNKRRRFKAKARRAERVKWEWLRRACAQHRREMRERYAVIHVYA
jgi:hypothetical protein